ncbi:uncharacterized protein N7479_009444 [Penicillium vulpinum]|uniref:uncharacterized protein n=1 Tax=Penicillium vulpinum TaxID=29845 RepID=UPI0025494E89|nr:uncharacterized protein N7479_009444 [Penicillium vulpinum]KAJ5951031.1 hypothetical protein N7479_009444 [Penicillium vulpinum]
MITDRKSWILREKPNLFVLIRYLLSGTLLPRLYIYIPLGTILLILLVELFLFIFRNGVFPLRPYSQQRGNTAESKDCTYKAPIYRGRPIYKPLDTRGKPILLGPDTPVYSDILVARKVGYPRAFCLTSKRAH